MKIVRTHHILFAIVLVLFVGWSLASGSYVPYSSDNVFHHQTAFEGFEEKTKNTPKPAPSPTPAPAPPRPVKGMGARRTGKHDKTQKSFFQKIAHEAKEKMQHLGKTPKEGFSDFQSANEPPEKLFDVFSGLTASKTCKPSGFSNAQGFLCLSDEAVQMLVTRGGNAH